MMAVPEIMREIMDLSRQDRSYLAKKLIESLEGEEPFSEEEKAVFSRRSREIRESVVQPLSLGQLKEALAVGLE